MIIKRIVLFLIVNLFIISNQFNIEINECEENLVDQILTNYFHDINCITIIDLIQNNTYYPFIKNKVPKYVKKINTNELKTNKINTRPRRDILDTKRTIGNYCPENGQGFIIITSTAEQIQRYMYSEMVTVFWSQQAMIFIYSMKEFENIFEEIWNIFKTPHLVTASCKNNTIYFYKPFERIENNWGATKEYKMTEIIINPKLIKHDFRNLNGYKLKLLLFKSPLSIQHENGIYSGLDITFLEFLSKFLNFTPVILEPYDTFQYGFKLDNGSFTGALRRLLDSEADFINVNYFITDYLTTDIEFASSAISDSLCIIARKAEKVPDWQLLYYCFGDIVWLLLLLTYPAMIVFWLVIRRLLNNFQAKHLIHPCIFMDSLRVILATSLPRLPSITTERVFLATCLISFVTIIGAFQGSLVGVFSTPVCYKDIETLEELSWSNTKIVSAYQFIISEVFTDIANPKTLRLKNLLKFYNENMVITKKVAEAKDYATIVRRSEFDLDKSTTSYLDAQGNDLIHMIRECARSYNLAYPLPVNWYLAPRFGSVLLRSARAGLFVKWYDEMADEVARTKRQASVTDGFKIFALKDVQIAFYILVIGMVCAFVVFIVEIVRDRKIDRSVGSS